MKILFLQMWYDYYGGIETVNDSLATQFAKDGNDVTVLCLWRMGINEIIEGKNYKKIVIDFERKRPSYKKMLSSFFHFKFVKVYNDLRSIFISKFYKKKNYITFKKYIDKIDPDYIIVGNYPLIKYVPKRFLKKCFLHMHSGFKYYINHDKKFLLKYNNKINKYVWLSKNLMNCAIKEGYLNSTYIFNPVRFNFNKNNELNQKNVVYVGRISPEKCLNKLIDIFNSRNEKYKSWKLCIYGSGDDSNLRFNSSIIKKGSTSNVKNVFKGSSILTLTSEREGFPMVILEAYECGIPVIAYDFEVSSSEIIKDGETGFIIPQDDKKEYVRKLELLMSDDKLRKEMGKNAKKFVMEFHIEKIVKKWYSLFKGDL